MRKTGFRMMLGCCLMFGAAMIAGAQGRKAGLWEMTSQMTWQQSPMPAGMQMPAGMPNPFNMPAHTSKICLTQQMIDKYGAPVPQAQNPRGKQQCTTTNVKLLLNGMTADMDCTGAMTGHGTMQSTYLGDTAKGKLHFTGTMQMGPGAGAPVEWTVDSTSTFLGPDCGDVKPLPMPDSK